MKLFQEPSRINDYLWLGSARHASNRVFLEKHGIAYILCVHTSMRMHSGFTQKHVPLSDYGETDLLEKSLDKCIQFIDSARKTGKCVLVHCHQGINRSPTVVLAYLMAREQLSLEAAYNLTVARRPQICPHEKYMEQLQAYELKLRGTSSFTEQTLPKSLQQAIRELRAEAEAEQAQAAAAAAAAEKAGDSREQQPQQQQAKLDDKAAGAAADAKDAAKAESKAASAGAAAAPKAAAGAADGKRADPGTAAAKS